MAPKVLINSLRNENESKSEWNLRRKFLKANIEDLDLDRLVCLSRCFINIVVYNCSYPPPVMREVHQRGKHLLEDRETAFDTDLTKSNPTCSANLGISCPSEKDTAKPAKQHQPLFRPKFQGISFVPASDSSKPSTNPAPDKQQLEMEGCDDNDVILVSASPIPDNDVILVSASPIPDDNDVVLVSASPTPDLQQAMGSSSNACEDSLTGKKSKQKCKEEMQVATVDLNERTSTTLGEDNLTLDNLPAEDRHDNSLPLPISQLQQLAMALRTCKGSHPITNIMEAVQKARLSVSFETHQLGHFGQANCFSCTVCVEEKEIATGHGRTMKIAKQNAFQAAKDEVVRCSERFSEANPSKGMKNERLLSSQNSLSLAYHPFGHSETVVRKRQHNSHSLLQEFVIVEPDSDSETPPGNTLQRSAALSRKLIDCDISMAGDSYRCVLSLESDLLLADVIGATQPDAKSMASCKALEMLKQNCWTIKIKVVESDKRVSKDQFLKSSNILVQDAISEDTAIGSSNVGSKMLQKMGWSGGGLGKESTGIEEPVTLQRVFNREGLGLSAEKGGPAWERFQTKVKNLLQDYAVSESLEEFVFSAELEKHERMFIHMECRKYRHLNSKSYGKGDNRYLVISRKRSIQELLRHLQSVGGETDCYRLVPPSS